MYLLLNLHSLWCIFLAITLYNLQIQSFSCNNPPGCSSRSFARRLLNVVSSPQPSGQTIYALGKGLFRRTTNEGRRHHTRVWSTDDDGDDCDNGSQSITNEGKPSADENGMASAAVTRAASEEGGGPFDQPQLERQLDKEIANVAVPAFVSLAADPVASIVDAMYVGRLGAAEQAAMGVAINAQYNVAKLYNDPLLKTSTSLVAGKTGEDLEASVATAVVTSLIIGVMQFVTFWCFGQQLLRVMQVSRASDMYAPALGYMRYRAIGVPAATVLLVTNGVFRGRGDTKTPLYCTTFGNLVNILLDPVLIFGCGMGCAGAGAATAISQWAAAIPLLILLNRQVPIKIFNRDRKFYSAALRSYLKAGGLIFIRTIVKILAYTVTAGAAARLGTVVMAAYALTFNLGFATSQICEAVSIAAQSLLARDVPFNSSKKKAAARHVIRRSLLLGLLSSSLLSLATLLNQDKVLGQLTRDPQVFAAAASIMPVVLVTQLFKSLAYATGGVVLGGCDWFWSSFGMQVASALCVGLVYALPNSLWNIWVALAAFFVAQVVVAGARVASNTGPWEGLDLLKPLGRRSNGAAEALP